MKYHQNILGFIIYVSQIWLCLCSNCEVRHYLSGQVSYSFPRYWGTSKCWIIEVPEGLYTRLYIKSLSLPGSCSNSYVKVLVSSTSETFTFCSQDTKHQPVIALSDVNVTYYNYNQNRASFTLVYTTESLICGLKNHFRCSNHSCIHEYQVCNGIKECKNGTDEAGCEKGVAAVKGVNVSRSDAISWLKTQRSGLSGWGKNTHRAITALYLAEEYYFNGDLEEELIAKQLELQTSIAILRNSSDPVSISELSMFINALMVTCHNPRFFYGYDLLQLLYDRVSNSSSASPVAYLTLCVANWNVSNSQITKLINILHKHSEYPFYSDVQAMTMMALNCIKNKTKDFGNVTNATRIYNDTLKTFMSSQLSDESFGNSYTTALIIQALLSAGEESNKMWNLTSAVQYLMRKLNSSSIDLLLTYFTLPILSNKSLVDISTVDCSNNSRAHGKDDEILDVLNKLGGKMRVQFSLYIGDQKDVIHTVYLRVPENSSAYDVMRIAQVADPKYKFQYRGVSGYLYIYEIAGIASDPEAGKFWLLYTADSSSKDTFHHHTKSPDSYILKNEEHLIMWYKTVHV